MKYLLFGTGDYYNRYKKWFEPEDVLALLDNAPEKQNTLLDGIPVLSPQEGIKLEYDAVIILSFYVKSMKQQLVELGVEEEKIIHFFDLHKIPEIRNTRKPVCYYGGAEELILKPDTDRKKNCAVVTGYDTGRSGNCTFSCGRDFKTAGLSGCVRFDVRRSVKRDAFRGGHTGGCRRQSSD